MFGLAFVLLLPHLFSSVIANKKTSITVEEIAAEINIVSNTAYSTQTFATFLSSNASLKPIVPYCLCCSLKYGLSPQEIKRLRTSKLCPHTLAWINTNQSGLYAEVVFLQKGDP